MSGHTVRVVQRHFYNTFQERGVLLPFTSPALVGARARPGRGRDIEILLPNPSGGLGFYIMSWQHVRTMARPTVHDMRLYDLLTRQPALTPWLVRQVARTTAREGLAGRPAAAAAAAADAFEQQEIRLTTSLVLDRLVEQMERPGTRPRLVEDSATGAARRIEAAVQAAAAQLGQSPQRLRAAVERAGELFAPVRGAHLPPPAQAGLGEPRVMTIIAAMERLCLELERWPPITHEVGAQTARELANAAHAGAVCARAIATDVAHRTDNPLELLGMLLTSPEQIAQLAERPDWAVNGWDQVAIRWRSPDDEAGCTELLRDLLPLIPLLPKQAGEWARMRIDFDLLKPPAGDELPAERNDPPSRTLELTSRLEALQTALLTPPPRSAAPRAAQHKAAVA